MSKFTHQIIANANKILPLKVVGVVHPCSDYALQGAAEIKQQGMGVAVVIGPITKIKKIACEAKIDLDGIELINAPYSHAAAAISMEMVNAGKLDILMKGSLHTDEMMHMVLDSKVGIKTNRRVTHCCIVDIPKYRTPFLVADIAINVFPDLDTKRHITQNAIHLAQALGLENIRVAILSADEQVRSQIPSTLDAASLSKMAERGQITGALVDGPLAFDTAISMNAAQIKELRSEVAGLANVLIVPTLEAGNILVKQLKYFAGAIMPGIAIGAKVPIILTSRADESHTRLVSCALAIVYANWYNNFLNAKNNI